AEEGSAWLKVVLPADAELWVNYYKSRRSGRERSFTISDLAEGYDYSYTIYARVYRDGQYYTQSKTARITPGYEYTVHLDFFQSPSPSYSYDSSPSYSYGGYSSGYGSGYSSGYSSGSTYSSGYSSGGYSSGGYSSGHGGFSAGRYGPTAGGGGGTGPTY